MEDTQIEVPIEIRVVDEASESFEFVILGDSVPLNATLFGEGGRVIPRENGNFTLTPEDVDALTILPPQDLSSETDPQIVLQGVVIVNDTVIGGASDVRETPIYE